MTIQHSSHATNPREHAAVRARRLQPALRHGVAALALWLVSTAMSCAAPLSLSALPSRIELSDRTPSVDVTMHNDGNAVIIVRLQPMVWVSDPVIDHYAPTADVQTTPPVFALQPGATQQVHVDLLRPAGAGRGATYQLSWQAAAGGADPRS